MIISVISPESFWQLVYEWYALERLNQNIFVLQSNFAQTSPNLLKACLNCLICSNLSRYLQNHVPLCQTNWFSFEEYIPFHNLQFFVCFGWLLLLLLSCFCFSTKIKYFIIPLSCPYLNIAWAELTVPPLHSLHLFVLGSSEPLMVTTKLPPFGVWHKYIFNILPYTSCSSSWNPALLTCSSISIMYWQYISSKYRRWTSAPWW